MAETSSGNDVGIADRIARLALDHFEKKISKSGKPGPREWTVMAAIVLLRSDTDEMSVVAMATGSKCIGPIKMSPLGDVINDSHAEVLARRSFIRFLMAQLALLGTEVSHNSIFLNKIDSVTGLYEVKSDMSFHLYTSQAPCGDASIFDTELTVSMPSKRRRMCPDTSSELFDKDIHRTGAKSVVAGMDPKLPGRAYHLLGVLRTKPGRGDPTRSMYVCVLRLF